MFINLQYQVAEFQPMLETALIMESMISNDFMELEGQAWTDFCYTYLAL
jgi:hypothetical protein